MRTLLICLAAFAAVATGSGIVAADAYGTPPSPEQRAALCGALRPGSPMYVRNGCDAALNP